MPPTPLATNPDPPLATPAPVAKPTPAGTEDAKPEPEKDLAEIEAHRF